MNTLGKQERPKPFLKNPGSWRETASPVGRIRVIRVIRVIVVSKKGWP